MGNTWLGVDIGGTASRWVVVDADGAIVARGETSGATGFLFNPADRERFIAVLGAIGGALGAGSEPFGACLGVTGLGTRVAADAKALVGDAFGLDPAAVIAIDDMELAFRAAFAPGEGHLIAAGTGSVGLHVTGDGTLVRVGGRGLLIDDGGSGTWIALTALDQLYRRIDETGGPAEAHVLAADLFAAMGGEDWDTTRAFVYGSDRGRIGTLAQVVAGAAAKGDPLAQAVMKRAGEELARLGLALIGRTQKLPVGYVGGIVNLAGVKPALLDALAGHDVIFPKIDAAHHAALMARRAA
jgi:N-acetylglucosamine kinase-like BadF-type ATPase